jgi:hypothetical protein
MRPSQQMLDLLHRSYKWDANTSRLACCTAGDKTCVSAHVQQTLGSGFQVVQIKNLCHSTMFQPLCVSQELRHMSATARHAAVHAICSRASAVIGDIGLHDISVNPWFAIILKSHMCNFKLFLRVFSRLRLEEANNTVFNDSGLTNASFAD